MDFTIPTEIREDGKRFRAFLDEHMMQHLNTWYRDGEVPRAFHERMCQGGWIGFEMRDGRLAKRPALREATLGEIYGRLSPGTAVATLAHADLGIMALWLWGSDELKKRYAPSALSGRTLMCLGNTESGLVASLAGNTFSVVSGGVACVVGVALCVLGLPLFWRYTPSPERAD